jgi:integrase
MKTRYSLICRGHRGGIFYCYDAETKKRESLGTKDANEAQRLINAKNEAGHHATMNLQLARVYLQHSDPAITTRIWQNIMDELAKLKSGVTAERFDRAIKDKAFDSIRNLPAFSTTGQQFLRVLEEGNISTNMFLRRIHNFALSMNFIPVPILTQRNWPAVHHKEKRAITHEEHLKIIEREKNSELKAYYQLCWHLGGAQSDIASLDAEDINRSQRIIAFSRKKTKVPVIISYGDELAGILSTLPISGPLFPHLIKYHERHRSQLFTRRCRGLKISGITLHSYRYAWAERAKQAGYPERFAQQALGHNSKAVHRAYAKNALVRLPALEEYEAKIVHLPQAVNQ